MLKNMTQKELDNLAVEILGGSDLTDNELRELLSITEKDELENLYYVSRKIRDHFFENRVFLYSFIYFSTYCRNKCTFCYYRESNSINRYRLGIEEVRDICRTLKGDNIHMVDLTMGEDPYFHERPERFADLVRAVKEELDLPIMISPGVMGTRSLRELYDSGADFLALYQETHDRQLYRQLRVGQSFENRVNARRFAKSIGYCVEDGILTGVGNDIESTIRSLRGMEENKPDMVRVMTFVPQEGTPLGKRDPESSREELKIIAILRLLFPDRLIPASLDLEGIPGMVHRLNAGANVVTSIIPSDSTLEGVVNYDRGLERHRDPKSVIQTLRNMGMETASRADFEKILKRSVRRNPEVPAVAL
ncbi:methylornithine synthase PylB [Methanolobus halotolerans]|uniref:Methylornithine synthase PylB n=1 Tax=Methanolobus halotolerans TaxID=2052935 RepID=A0A4E0PYX4_9EURY|nr:methylornithine synthase PylB [Methanolobus halotolerans]TGC09000.1 methylornithine synthase PylB [Methanolobus halotolerans]